MDKLKTARKITMATVRSFIKRNRENLYLRFDSSFDGMYDVVMPCKDPQFHKASPTDKNLDRTQGVKGAWFVGSSRDSFSLFENEGFIGVDVYNSCGSFVIAIKK